MREKGAAEQKYEHGRKQNESTSITHVDIAQRSFLMIAISAIWTHPTMLCIGN